MNNYPRVCVPRLLTVDEQARSVQLAIAANPDNLLPAIPKQGTGELMAVEISKKWLPGHFLRVRFLNGTATQKAKCQLHAKKWEKYANIKFVFNDSPNAELRVAFYDPNSAQFNDQGSWSYVGTDCGLAKHTDQTINFGWLDDTTDDAEWERVVVHEFGHTLGCDHEDQQPAETIKWNKDAVYKYFEGPPNNWSKDDVDANVLTPTSSADVTHTTFDPTSIMAYQIPPEFTLDGKGVVGGSTLSNMDKVFIGQLYPFKKKS